MCEKTQNIEKYLQEQIWYIQSILKENQEEDPFSQKTETLKLKLWILKDLQAVLQGEM